jgi:hypothetical protein
MSAILLGSGPLVVGATSVVRPDLSSGTLTNVGLGVGSATPTRVSVALASGAAVGDGTSTEIVWPATVGSCYEIVFRARFTGTSSGDRVAVVMVVLASSGHTFDGHKVYVSVDQTGSATVFYDTGAPLGGRNSRGVTTSWCRLLVDGNRVAAWLASSNVFLSAFVDNSTVLPSQSVSSTEDIAPATLRLELTQVNSPGDGTAEISIDNLSIKRLHGAR